MGKEDRLGLPKRKLLYESMQAWAKVGRGFAVGVVDVDEFGRFNRENGLKLGDSLLQKVADVLGKNLRGSDLACRLELDHFLVLMPDSPPEAAFMMLEDVRRVLADREHSLKGGKSTLDTAIHVSGGVSGFPRDGRTWNDALRAAEEAMFAAKRSGRNRLSVAATEKMRLKSSYFTVTQLERLSGVARDSERSEAFLLREALDDLLKKYGG